MFDLFDGFDVLLPLSEYSGLPLDQVNFIVSQLAAFIFGIFFRFACAPSILGGKARHVIEIIVGFSILFFCFGLQSIFLLVQTIVAYIIMSTMEPKVSQELVFVFSMIYLGSIHSYKMYTNYAKYVLDITGPLMVNTQRVTSMAFSYADGLLGTEFSKQRSIEDLPGMLEVLSYSLSFHTVIGGPFCFYKDYAAFIEGNDEEDAPVPRAFWPTLMKLASAVMFAVIFMNLSPLYYIQGLVDPALLNSPYWYITLYLVAAVFVIRCRYYFAWKLTDAVNYGAGLGFTTEDENDKQTWDIVDTVDIIKVEFASNLKALSDGWNKPTSQWLRHIVYDRGGSSLRVFMVDAYWHGFYPGFYISFAGAAFFINLSKLVRQRVRPLFQGDKETVLAYDLMTFALTKVFVSFLALPFLLMDFNKILVFYKNIFFAPFIAGIVLFLILKMLNFLIQLRKRKLSDGKSI